jgi:hypothetical protein
MNRDLRPVIQNAKITSPNSPASTLFISGIPYALDIFRQFLTPVMRSLIDLRGVWRFQGRIRESARS